MYRASKTVVDRNADYKVLLQTKAAVKFLRTEGVGRQCFIIVEPPLTIVEDGVATGKYIPGYQSVAVPRPVAEKFITDSLKNFEHRGAHIQLHVYSGCIFIGGHHYKEEGA